jgi:hypothetical protein
MVITFFLYSMPTAGKNDNYAMPMAMETELSKLLIPVGIFF